jgi:hypothetical protein
MSNQHMTDSTTGSHATGKGKTSEEHRPYLYRHAGIMERDGHIPFWLILVVVGLIIWSVYYSFQYWSPG